MRLKEHCANIMHDRHKKSALAEHTHHSRHHILIEETKLITREDHYKRRKTREAIEIEKFPLNLNRDDGLKLNECWSPIIRHLKDTNTQKINQWQGLGLELLAMIPYNILIIYI